MLDEVSEFLIQTESAMVQCLSELKPGAEGKISNIHLTLFQEIPLRILVLGP